jgi:hypothetical protein
MPQTFGEKAIESTQVRTSENISPYPGKPRPHGIVTNLVRALVRPRENVRGLVSVESLRQATHHAFFNELSCVKQTKKRQLPYVMRSNNRLSTVSRRVSDGLLASSPVTQRTFLDGYRRKGAVKLSLGGGEARSLHIDLGAVNLRFRMRRHGSSESAMLCRCCTHEVSATREEMTNEVHWGGG